MSLRGRLGVATGMAVISGGLVAGVGAMLDDGSGPITEGPGVVTIDVGIERSRFDLGALRVREGTVVQFVVRNHDPIDHELIVGDDDVHRRHAEGTEREHPPVPGEVSVAPDDSATTYYEFSEPGTVVYACHLPGHVAYGMTGEIEVVPAS